MDYRLSLLCIIGMLLPKTILGQDNWSVTGTITDSIGFPLTMATVFAATTDSTEKILTFGNTDTLGNFNLTISNNVTQVWLNTRYLGYKPVRYLCQKNGERYLKLVLSLETNTLHEIVISSKPTAISVKDDTTSYRLASFRDSTEYNIEDVLKKLPGLQVKENGEILFNGKPIDKLLIEGSDLFGRKYSIGTKNIRADFIDRVEVIEHYQENPMLKNLNLSDAVILNLKMSDNKKRIISGTLNVGIGAGDELKGSLHANLFSISKKNKIIVLSDNGNNGQQSDPSEILATYDQIDNQDLKIGIQKIPDFIETSTVDNPGLPTPYIVNALSTFSTIRSEFSLKKDFNVNLNVAYLQSRDVQKTSNEQFFASEQTTYGLITNRVLRFEKKLIDFDMYATHFSKNKKYAFQSYAEFDMNAASSHQDLSEYRPMVSYTYENRSDKLQKNILLSSLNSFRTGEKSIFQILIKLQNTRQPQVLSLENKDFANYYRVDTSYLHVDQSNEYRFQGIEFTGKYTFSRKRMIGSVEVKYANVASTYLTEQNLTNDVKEKWPILPSQFNTIRSKKLQTGMSLKYDINQTTYVQGQVQVVSQVLDTIIFDHSVAPTFKLFMVKHFVRIGEIRFGHTWTKALPELHNYIGINYLSNFSVINSFYRNTPTLGQKVFIHYRNQEETKFRSYYAYIAYNFGEISFRDDIQFYRSIQVLKPYLAKGNQSINGNANFDQFIPRIKTSLSLNLSLSKEIGHYLIEQEPSKLTNYVYGFRTSIKYNFWRNTVQFNIGLSGLMRLSEFSTTLNHSSNKFNNNNILFGIQYKKKNWRFSYNIAVNQGKSDIYNSSNFFGSHARVMCNMTLFRKKINIEGILYNIGNRMSYNTVSSDAYFNFRSSIEAVPRFLMLKLDMSL